MQKVFSVKSLLWY